MDKFMEKLLSCFQNVKRKEVVAMCRILTGTTEYMYIYLQPDYLLNYLHPLIGFLPDEE